MALSDLKRQGYRLQRGASQGATITLLSGCGYYTALFECATRCASILGERTLQDVGDGILEVIPSYKIPTEELNLALQKLSKQFSIALVEYVCEKAGGRFVLLWRIDRSPSGALTPSTNLDDY